MELATTEDLAAIDIDFIKPAWIKDARNLRIDSKTIRYTTSKDGKYSQIIFRAGICLKLKRIYKGKRDGVILQFTAYDAGTNEESKETKGKYIEIALKNIPSLTDRYEEFIRTLLGRNAKPTEEEIQQMKENNNAFYIGTPGWGDFA